MLFDSSISGRSVIGVLLYIYHFYVFPIVQFQQHLLENENVCVKNRITKLCITIGPHLTTVNKSMYIVKIVYTFYYIHFDFIDTHRQFIPTHFCSYLVDKYVGERKPLINVLNFFGTWCKMVGEIDPMYISTSKLTTSFFPWRKKSTKLVNIANKFTIINGLNNCKTIPIVIET